MPTIVNFAQTAGFGTVAELFETLGKADAKAEYQRWLDAFSDDADPVTEPEPERTWKDERLEIGRFENSKGKTVTAIDPKHAKLAHGATEESGIVYGPDARSDDGDVRLISYRTKRDGTLSFRHTVMSVPALLSIAEGVAPIAELLGRDLPAEVEAAQDDADDAENALKPRVRAATDAGLPPQNSKKVTEWRKYAKQHDIPLGGAKRKDDIYAAIRDHVTNA